MVREAMVGVIDMLGKTLEILERNGASDPSYSRYHLPGDIGPVRGVLQLVLAYLGAPESLETAVSPRITPVCWSISCANLNRTLKNIEDALWLQLHIWNCMIAILRDPSQLQIV